MPFDLHVFHNRDKVPCASLTLEDGRRTRPVELSRYEYAELKRMHDLVHEASQQAGSGIVTLREWEAGIHATERTLATGDVAGAVNPAAPEGEV